jgi:putative ABC transport system substrate-binding protein
MRRRDFITLLGGAAAAWPLGARAQQPALPVVGYLNSGSPGPMHDLVSAFHAGLNESGYIEGQNVNIEYRWAEGQYDRQPALIADLIARKVTVIAAAGTTPGALAAKAATQTIPIVFVVGTDPVGVGLVSSLARPGGNVTGVTIVGVELIAKCLELMHQLVPAGTKIAVLLNPTNVPQTQGETRDVQAVAASLGAQVVILHASNPGEIGQAFATTAAEGAGALVVSGEIFFFTQSDLVVALAARQGLPAIYAYRKAPEAGGLISYGTDIAGAHRTGGVYTGRILKGEKPADLPVQQATRIELVINLKTAKALNVAIPLSLLGRADEVIE